LGSKGVREILLLRWRQSASDEALWREAQGRQEVGPVFRNEELPPHGDLQTTQAANREEGQGRTAGKSRPKVAGRPRPPNPRETDEIEGSDFRRPSKWSNSF